jgi:hypothetical protein
MMEKEKCETTACIDEIEANVYKKLKQHGFRKYGRTLHRFVSEDISQLINFQCGQAYRDETHLMWVNLGIRVPECFDKEFIPSKPMKKYYHEYECTIRSRLGTIDGNKEKCFNLKGNIAEITTEILDDIEGKVLPVFNILSTRETILAHRRDYPQFDTLHRHLILLEESMIYGHLGSLDKAEDLFEQYYQTAVDKYNDAMINGKKEYLKKGQRIVYMNQDITAKEDGYVTIYGASHGHIDYLDVLAVTLGFRQN